MCMWFSNFLENALVRRVKRRICIRMVLAGTNTLGGAIATLGTFRNRAVQLHKLRIINVPAESAFNRFQICPVAVAGELHAVRQPVPQIVHERDCIVAMPRTAMGSWRLLSLGRTPKGTPCCQECETSSRA